MMRGRSAALLAGLLAVLAPAAADAAPVQVPVRQLQATDTARIRSGLEAAVSSQPGRAAAYLELARFEVTVDRLQRAEAILRTGLTEAAADPNAGSLRLALLELLSAEERTDDAWTVLREAPAQEAPELRDVWLGVTRALVARGRADDARTALDAALSRYPGDPEFRLVRAATLPPRQAAPEMVAALKDLRARRPDDVQVAVSLSGYLAGSGKLTESLALQDTLLSAERPAELVFRHTGEFWLGVGQADSAAVRLERGAELHRSSPEIYALLGQAQAEAGRPGDAGAAFDTAARLNDEASWLLIRAARQHVAAGDVDAALRNAADVPGTPASLPAILDAAGLALSLGSPDTAEWILRRAALAYPSNRWLAELEIDVWMAQDQRATALEAMERLAAEGSPVATAALIREGRAPAVQTTQAGIRGGLERIAQGERAFLAQGAPSGYNASTLLAGSDLEQEWARARLEQDRQAVESLLEEAVFRSDWGPAELGRLRQIYPGSVLLARLDARLALQQGHLARAREEVERLLDLQPRSAEIHGLHGRILEADEATAEARAAYVRALELDPGAPDAFASLVRLHRADDSLPALLARVQRLRTISPGDTLRMDHEVELLQRLGRLVEARDLAAERADRARALRQGGSS